MTQRRHGLELTSVEILDRVGQEALGKPPGRYLTLELEPQRLRESGYRRRAIQLLAEQLQTLLNLRERDPVLVVGLGNAAVTPDAVGPRLLEHLLVTRHLPITSLRPVAGLIPGVLGCTGVESLEVVQGVVERMQPARVLVADALVSREPNRIGTTVQVADTGIVPGSGIGNHRAAMNETTLGVPVIALGVPTVVDARTLCLDLLGSSGQIAEPTLLPAPGWMVTPREIDPVIDQIATLLGMAVNQALQGHLRPAELEALSSS